MTKGDYPYPADEFDSVELVSGPRGVHRTPRSRWSKTWPFLLVLVLFPALAYGAVTYWSQLDDGADAGATTTTDTGTASDTATDEATATETEPAVETPADPVVETPAPIPADLSTPVVVFNATSTSGLAAGAVGVLEDAGWTDASATDYTGGGLDTSTVRYSVADLQTTAQAAADALGITTVELVEGDAIDGLEIVLESDFEP
ncbi:LytR C-terminal domain-containing protein [Pengzhenrongella sicca]|uniref:LytR C-terminal domain-containing protein n=1 Tax=Pengzhenrongella sicca TaxID=2819238 RepID=A0A8A4ZFP8_9MICO|nr:LytR C-terminal domain-containing protein [Pengzhenrongella sicca]QTE29829.1 LytR C-terminal domain-containing protein [Pengzhenrongella sicca]